MSENKEMSKDDRDNRSRQLNEEHDAYHRSRGREGRDDPRPTHRSRGEGEARLSRPHP